MGAAHTRWWMVMGLLGARTDLIDRASKERSPVGQSSYWETDTVDNISSLQTCEVNAKKSECYFFPKTSLGMYMEDAHPWP